MKKSISLIALLLVVSLVSSCFGEYTVGGSFTKDDYQYTYLRNGNLRLEKYLGDSDTVNIPSSIDGHDIESIGPHAFAGKKVSKVTLPTTVKMICSFAFSGCENIQRFAIPNTCYVIDGNPFPGCTSLVNISVEPNHPTLSVTSDGVLYNKNTKTLLCYPSSKSNASYNVAEGTKNIAQYAFFNCTALNQITLPNTLERIAQSAFYGCSALTTLKIPQSVLTIGLSAFAGCMGLTKVTLPEQLTRLEAGLFYGCKELRDLTLPAQLQYIGDRVFYGCEALDAISIPETVSAIGKEAFRGCSNLTRAYVSSQVIEIGDAAFDDCSVRLYIYTQEYSFAQLYAKIWDISYTYGTNDEFLRQ